MLTICVMTRGAKNCWLAMAAVGLRNWGWTLRAAVARAHAYVQAAIAAAPGIGRGHGPLGHAVTVERRWLDG